MHALPVLQSNRVSAVFQDATMLVLDLDREATLGELAEEIGELAKFHGGLFLPVRVRSTRTSWMARSRIELTSSSAKPLRCFRPRAHREVA
jgi:hypothetical protein